ncbi:MAG: elongation factor P [Saprospiraceae bacterium]|nr:MAG: elongation factor P [Saprospiraceae bacterium]
MANTSDIRNGMCIELNGDIWTIIEFQHVKPGKGGAFVRTKLKSLTKGKVVDNTFSAGHAINEVRVERRAFQYLYKDDMGYHFMNMDDYEQVQLNENMLENPQFLKEGMQVDVLFHAQDNIPLNMEMPAQVTVQVTYTEPGLRGDTATNTLKPATVDTGAEVRVPLFINQGDNIIVDTRTGGYLGRA